jgi:filamentous hemagglutinin
MRKRGFDPKHPIDVIEADGALYIRNGHHRAAAAAKARIPKVPIESRLAHSAEEAAELFREFASTLSDNGF